MTKVANTPVAAAPKKVYKNTIAVRMAKAEASKRHRERTKLEDAGETVPAEYTKREGYQRGIRTIDESGLDAAGLSKLNALRVSKKDSTTRFKQRQKLIASGVAEDQLPAELQKRVGLKTADSAVAGVVAPRRTAKVDPATPVTYQDMKNPVTLKRGGEQITAALKAARGSYVLTKTDASGQTIASATLKRNQLPATYGAFIKLVDKTKTVEQA